MSRGRAAAFALLGLAWVATQASAAAHATRASACTSAQLTLTGVAAEGTAVSAGEIVDYHNVSGVACSLHGYPTVVMLGDAAGRALLARDERDGYLGGWVASRRSRDRRRCRSSTCGPAVVSRRH